MKLAAAVVTVVALVGGTADVLALRPHRTRPAIAQRHHVRGELVSVVLADGTMLISRSDWQGGTYPIGRRFVPALP